MMIILKIRGDFETIDVELFHDMILTIMIMQIDQPIYKGKLHLIRDIKNYDIRDKDRFLLKSLKTTVDALEDCKIILRNSINNNVVITDDIHLIDSYKDINNILNNKIDIKYLSRIKKVKKLRNHE